MLKVEIRDFQSISHVVVDVDGFSALVGRSNIGKSAVVRAVKAALTGAPADAFVRHSAECPRGTKGAKSCKCFCSVRITTEGFDLLWEKGDTVNRYVFNAVEYTAVSRGTPDFLLKDFAPVKLGDEKEIIQISDQFRPIFILDKTGTVVADVLSDVVKLDQINVAIRLAEKDRKDAAATRKVREKDVGDLSLALSSYDGLDPVVDRVQGVEAVSLAFDAKQLELDQLDRYIETVFGLVSRIKALNQGCQVQVPVVDTAFEEANRLSTLVRLDTSLKDRQTLVSRLAPVESVDVPTPDSVPVGDMLLKLFVWANKLDALRDFFNLSKIASTLEVPSLEPASTVHSLLSQLATWHHKVESAVNMITKLEGAVAKADLAEIEVLKDFQTLGVCPTCSQEFTAEHAHHA
jgi:hypothetical protein